jgi:pimeloyl-ACP methyl ester carboxylesterase
VHQHADDAAALIDALGASPAVLVGRSYGVDTAVDVALRYPDRVRALALLEGCESVTEAGREWLGALRERVLAAAENDPGTVAETLIRFVLGDAAWRGFPEPVRQVFTENGPAIVAELRGGPLEPTEAQLRSLSQPTLLVTAADSAPIYADVTEALAAVIPQARVERVAGGHVINPAHPAVLAFVDEVL